MIARIWEGRTREEVAEEYAAYLHEHGVKKLTRATRSAPTRATTSIPPYAKHMDVLTDE